MQPLTKQGRIAQLVQSTWFTPKGSGVRIPLRPQKVFRNEDLFLFMNYFTYILYSEKLDKYYVGYTKEISQRLEQHLWKHKGFTGKADDWIVKYVEG